MHLTVVIAVLLCSSQLLESHYLSPYDFIQYNRASVLLGEWFVGLSRGGSLTTIPTCTILAFLTRVKKLS